MKNKIKGISYIELIITISIIIITSSFLLLNSNTYKKYQVEYEFDNLVTDINTTKSSSIIKRTPTSFIIIDENNYSYNINDVESSVSLNYIQFDLNKTNRTSYRFTINGVPDYEGAGTMYVLKDNKTYKISITPVTGHINILRDDNES